MSAARSRLSLDGAWDCAFDVGQRGLVDGWGERGLPAGLPVLSINVPSVWQEFAPGHTGVVWYRRRFAAPASWQSQRVALTFGAVNYAAAAWLNGRHVGGHVGGYTPFTLDISAAIRPGQENELLVRVADCDVQREVDGYRIAEIPSAKEIWYHNFSGVYQPVSIETTSHAYLRDVFTVWRDCVLDVRLEIENTAQTSPPALWRVAVHDGDRQVSEGSGALSESGLGIHIVQAALSIADPHLWSPADPHLYRLTASLSGGMGGSDDLETRVGLRTISVRGGRLRLNGKPWRPRMILYQPHYPGALAYPPSDAYVRSEMAMMQQAGFDMVRFHLKPPPPLYLDLADEMGLTVYGETALGWIREGPAIDAHFAREIAETIRRDRNHASVVLWGIVNENRRQAARAESFLPLARQLDPSRPVVDNCGLFSVWDGGGWLSASHIRENGPARPWPDLHIYLRSPLTQEAYDWLNTLGKAGGQTNPSVLGYGDAGANRAWVESWGDKERAVFVSEFGVGAPPDLDGVVASYRHRHQETSDAADQRSLRDSLASLMNEHRLTALYPAIAALAEKEGNQIGEGLRWQMEALRSNPRLSGFGLLQFNDASWEIGAGLVDQWRRPKPFYAVAAAANAPLLLALSGHLRNVRVGETVDLRCTLVNEDGITGSAVLVWRLIDAAKHIAHEEMHAVRLDGRPVQELPGLSVRPEREGRHRFETRLRGDYRLLCQASGSLHAWNEAPFEAPAAPLLFRPADAQKNAPLLPAAGDENGGLWVLRDAGAVDLPALARVLARVRSGGRMLLLELWEDALERLNSSGLLPFALSLRCAPSSWLGYAHVAQRHPTFTGLPGPGLLGRQEYAHVLARRSLVGLPGESIVVALSSTGLERAQQQRIQPSFWAGSDLHVVPFGSGQLVFSQFLLRQSAGRDPVADRLLRNLLRETTWTSI